MVFSMAILRAVDIGSDMVVTRFNTQLVVDNGDRIAGFAALNAGFVFNGPLVTATYDSFFPVSGQVATNFGTLELNQDFILQDVASIFSWGDINANGHLLELAPSANFIPIESDTGSDCLLTLTFEQIRGDTVNTVHFSFDNSHLVSSAGTVLEVCVVINENFLDFVASTALARTINEAAWHPSKDYIGLGIASGTGDEIFTYTFSRSADTLTLIDSVQLGGGGSNGALAVAWHPDGDHLAVGTMTANTELQVYEVNADGTFGASTTADPGRNSNTVDWDADGGFLAEGNSAGGGEA